MAVFMRGDLDCVFFACVCVCLLLSSPLVGWTCDCACACVFKSGRPRINYQTRMSTLYEGWVVTDIVSIYTDRVRTWHFKNLYRAAHHTADARFSNDISNTNEYNALFRECTIILFAGKVREVLCSFGVEVHSTGVLMEPVLPRHTDSTKRYSRYLAHLMLVTEFNPI